jgi:hypothetical protein
VPEGAKFLDVDSIPVVMLPGGRCVAFAKLGPPESRPYTNQSKAGSDGDPLTREEFADWLVIGFNRFDARGN